jgi:uncharacterized membrane protein YbhN (UPF0104 family)
VVKALPKKSQKQSIKPNTKKIIGLGLMLIALYILLPQIGSFQKSLSLIGHINVVWFLAAASFAWATYFFAALVYKQLAKHSIPYFRTVLIEISSMFANRVLPAGIGAISVNYNYLRRNRHTSEQATAVVAANNVIGVIGNVILLFASIFLTHTAVRQLLHYNIKLSRNLEICFGLVVLLVIVLWIRLAGKSLYAKGIKILHNLFDYRSHLVRIITALIFSICLTSFFTLSLLACLEAVGVHLAFTKTLLVLTFGVVGGTVVPTPGGIGGVEAAMVAGFVAYGLPGSYALAAVLLYRILTYWLALGIGAVALSVSSHYNYL